MKSWIWSGFYVPFLTIRNCGGVAEPSGEGRRDDEGGGRGGEERFRSEQLRRKTTPTVQYSFI
jgi:hypothetical protein